jgi:hypothetical protein
MSRSRASAKAAGTRHETSIVGYLARHYDDIVERRRQSGAKDRGDISGWRFAGRHICAELKDYGGKFHVGTWLNEVEVERGNADAAVGLVIAKRRGTTDPGDQVVLMTLRDLVCLLTGERADDIPSLTGERP